MDILTDKGTKVLADTKLDMAIPFTQNEELRETIKEINEHIQALTRLVDRVNYIYAHGYVTVSVNSEVAQ